MTCAQYITRLVELISADKSRDPENVNPTENAISAVTKILKYNNSAIPNIDEVINVWYVCFVFIVYKKTVLFTFCWGNYIGSHGYQSSRIRTKHRMCTVTSAT